MLSPRTRAVLGAASLLALVGCEGEPKRPGEPETLVVSSDDDLTEFYRYDLAEPYPEAVEVRLFVADHGLDAEGRPQFSAPEGRRLSADQRAAFEGAVKRVSLRDPNNGPPPGGLKRPMWSYAHDDFSPRHFFRYYDAGGRQVGEIAVWFCEGQSRAEPRLPFETERANLNIELEYVARFVKGLGLPTDIGCDGAAGV